MTFFQSIWDYFKPDTPQKAESRPKKPPPQTGGYLDDTSEDTHDAFSRKPFAEKLAKSIASRSDEESLVIGIYGLWGEGKTTVLNYIKTELSTNHINSTICILFNPWRYKDDDELLRSFFETLAISLEKNLYDKGQQIGKLLTNYISVLKLIPTYGDVANEAVKKYSENTIEESKKKVSSILKVEKKRVVIFIDDIDRLDKNEIQALFKLIKLTADFPYTCYILSFDEEMASAILGEQYGHAENTTVAGRNFLEKIIQVPLHLPKASREQLRNYFFDNLNNILNDNQIEFSQKEQDDFTNAFFASIELRLTTPRAIKRYINALSFSIPLLKGETNMIDLMLLESMRLFYPELHAFVRNYPEFIIPQVYHKIAWQDELFTKQALSHINKALEKYNVSEKDAALNLLATLFPAYSVEYKTGDLKYDHRRHSLDKWLKEKRVASDEYYPRYFSYSVSDTDMSDIRIEEILINSEKQSVDDISKSILEEVPIEKADSFITKLRAKEDTLDTSLAIKLSKAIARVALFPDPEGNFLGHTPLSQASIFVFKAIRSIPKAEREEVITDIFNNAQPLYFAIRTFYRLRKINMGNFLFQGLKMTF